MSRELPARTKADLRAAVYHVTYEFEAMRRAADRFRRSQRRFDLEAALLHSRNMIEFFWTPSKKRSTSPDGIYAAHYYRSPEKWRDRRVCVPQWPNQRYPALCAQLSHISVERTKHDVVVDFGNEIQRITYDLATVWECFLKGLGRSDWRTRFRRRAAKWRAQP